MSNTYPFWWDKTITIFNKYVGDENKTMWQRAVLSGCFWKYINTTTYVNNVKMQTKEVIVRIPKEDNYVPYLDWKTLADRTDKFTLHPGDFIVLGDVDDEIDEYTKGQRATDVLNKYKDACMGFQIETYIEDIGNGLYAEHYKITGI